MAGCRPWNFMNTHSKRLAAVSKEIGFRLRCILDTTVLVCVSVYT